MEQVGKLKRIWNLVLVLQIVQKIRENYFPCFCHDYYIYELSKFSDLMSFGSTVIFKNTPCLLYYNSSWRHRFGKSWDCLKNKNLNILRTEHNFSTKWNRNLNLCLREHILRSCRFIAEVTFKLMFKCKYLCSNCYNNACYRRTGTTTCQPHPSNLHPLELLMVIIQEWILRYAFFINIVQILYPAVKRYSF